MARFASRSYETWTRKKGFAEKQLERLAGCIDRGPDSVRAEQDTPRGYVQDVAAVDAILEPSAACTDGQKEFDLLPYRQAEGPRCQREALHRRKTMRKARSKKKRTDTSGGPGAAIPRITDNLALFRIDVPKGFLRKHKRLEPSRGRI